MSSTQPLDDGYISDDDRLESEMKTSFDDLVSLLGEVFGVEGEPTTVSLASDIFTPQVGKSHYFIDTEGATASDDLRYIAGTARNGQLVALRSANASRLINIVNGAGGAGQILTKNGSDMLLAFGQFAVFKYVAGPSGYYEEWLRDETARIDQLFGARPATTSTITVSPATANQLLVSRARHYVDSAAIDHVDQLVGSTISTGSVVMLCTSTNTAYARTLKHNVAGTGKLNLIGGADIIMGANTWYAFVKNGNQYDHIFTVGGMLPAVGSAGGIPYFSAANVAAVLAAGTNGYSLEMVAGMPTWTNNKVAGPGAVTNHGIPIWDATNNTLKNGGAGTANQVLTSNGPGSDPTFQTPAAAAIFQSTDQNITAGGALTIPHGLGGTPRECWVDAICQTNDIGYTAGDVVTTSLINAGDANNSVNMSVKKNSTNLIVRFGTGTIALANASTGANANINPTSWKLRIYARL